ncbi:MAG: VTT domain-containing protein [Kofleriaceae bacterium]
MQGVLDALDGFGGVYLAVFVFAILSGVIPVTNSEVLMTALGAGSSYGWSKLLVLAAIVAVGQSITHAALYFTARGITRAGTSNSPKWEARIAKAHALAEKWKKSEVLMMIGGATIGVPPQVLVATVAGVIGIPFRTFATIDVCGRFVRFALIALIAHAAV